MERNREAFKGDFEHSRTVALISDVVRSSVEGCTDYTTRAKMTAIRARELKAELSRDMIELGVVSPGSFKEFVVASTFLGGVEVMGLNTSHQKVVQWPGEEDDRHSSLVELISASLRYKQDVHRYSSLFTDRSGCQAHAELLDMMLSAKKLVSDQRDLHTIQAGDVRNILNGMLAEYKVLNSLRQHGWERSRYGTSEEDIAHIDIVALAVEGGDYTTRLLQVKSKSSYRVELEASVDERSHIVHVLVPTHSSLDPFNLTEAEVELLNSTMILAPAA